MPRANSKMRRLLAVGAASAMMIGLAACSGGGGASDENTVVWSTWGTPEELTRFEEFNDEFMKRHPDITVELQPVASYSDYHSKLLAQLTSNTAPDVFYIGDDKIGQFVDAKVLAPLHEAHGVRREPDAARRLLPRPLRRRRAGRRDLRSPERLQPRRALVRQAGARRRRDHRGPGHPRRERRVDHREVPRDERQAGRGRPDRLDVLELLGHALQLDLVAGRHRLRRVRRIRRQRGRHHGRRGRHARPLLPGRHVRRGRHDCPRAPAPTASS